jgi:hypothetical protein
VVWILLIVRDGGFALFLVASQGFLLGPLAALGDVMWLAVVPVIGAIAAGYATYTDITRKHFESGTMAAVIAVGASSFPGIILVGPFGIGLGVAALVLHFVARKAFVKVDVYGRPTA